MPKFRKKPVVIEAEQFDGTLRCAEAIAEKFGSNVVVQYLVDGGPRQLLVETLEGVMVASAGDWIIRGVKGEVYPCKPDIFAATYDQVTEFV